MRIFRKLAPWAFSLLLLGFSADAKAQSDDNRVDRKSYEKAPKQKSPIAERIFVGGYLGASFGTVIYVDVSPLVGYRITNNFRGGVGFTYQFLKDTYWNYKYHMYGPRGFLQYNVFEGLYVHTEYEQLFLKYIEGDISQQEFNDTYPGLLLGAGYAFPMGGSSSFGFTALYNVLYESTGPYASPWVIRLGVQIGI